MLEICEGCGKPLKESSWDALCTRCLLAAAWPWGYLRIALMSLIGGAILVFVLR